MISRRGFLIGSAALAMAPRALGQIDQNDQARVRNISDAELFSSLDLTRDGLREVRSAVEQKDFPAAYVAWAKNWSSVVSRGKFIGVDSYVFSREEATRSIEFSRANVLAMAEKVLAHEIAGWGPQVIKHGPVVDFNADYGQSGKYGFHYWGFSLCLIHSFLLTGDQKYLDKFELLFNQWYEQRDKVKGGFPGLDVIWYELGVGMRNRFFLEYYFLPHEKRSIHTHERMLKTCLGAARWLHEEQKKGYRPANWQMIGCYGLAHLGIMLPEFKESNEWVNLAVLRTLEHMEQDFFPDGCHSERAPASYMILAYREPRNLGRLLEADPSRRELAEKMHAPLRRSLDFFAAILPPDGILPGINDGSRAALPETIRKEAGEPLKTSIHLPKSGFTVMRDAGTSTYLLINHGPWGGGHSHADSLSFELHAHGKPLAIDCGIGQTYDDPLHASWYIHSRAHNMLTIDGENLDRPAAEGKDVVWHSDDRLDHFAATHHGYAASKKIIHRRHIAFIKPSYFIVYDVVSAAADATEHTLEWNVHPTSNDGLIVEPSSKEWSKQMKKGWASVTGIPGYGKKNWAEIDWLLFTSKIAPSETKAFAVLLYPYKGDRPVVKFEMADATVTVQSGNHIDRIAFKDGKVTLS